MKERPILFSAPMVRAILDGRKTQTRRVVKFIPQLGEPEYWCKMAVSEPAKLSFLAGDYTRYCPYGERGERLWVKETWADHCAADASCAIHYRAGGCRAMLCSDSGAGDPVGLGRELPENPIRPSKWKPSIFMPRWASRITLEITAVRVERLQAISEEEAKAEGCDVADLHRCYPSRHAAMIRTYRRGYEELWGQINGPDSWTANPWVWVIEFKRKDAR